MINEIFNCISKSQGQNREIWSEGSETANPRADEQKTRIRPSVRMSEPSIAKSPEAGHRVNVSEAGGKISDLPGEISEIRGPSFGQHFPWQQGEGTLRSQQRSY